MHYVGIDIGREEENQCMASITPASPPFSFFSTAKIQRAQWWLIDLGLLGFNNATTSLSLEKQTATASLQPPASSLPAPASGGAPSRGPGALLGATERCSWSPRLWGQSLCAGLEAGLARGALGPLPLPFEIAARSPKNAPSAAPTQSLRLTDRPRRTGHRSPSNPRLVDHRCVWDRHC